MKALLAISLLGLLTSCASMNSSSEDLRQPAATPPKSVIPQCVESPVGNIGSADDMKTALAQKHAQLADLMAKARQKDMTCDISVYQTDVLQQVAKAREYDPKIQFSADVMKSIQNTLYRRLVDTFTEPTSIDSVNLSNINWDGIIFQDYTSGGIAGPAELRLRQGGILEERIFDVETGKDDVKVVGSWQYQFYKDKQYKNKKYRQSGSFLYFTREDKTTGQKKTNVFQIRYNSNGQIQLYKGNHRLNDGENSDIPVYTSFENSECDA